MEKIDLVSLVFYIIPGFIFLSTYYFFIPTQRRSDFVRLITSVIFSIVIYGIVIAVEQISKWEIRTRLAVYVFISWPCAILLAWLLSKIVQSVAAEKLLKLLKLNLILKPRVWDVVLDLVEAKPVKVVLNDGSVYIGNIKYYSLDPNDIDKELFLQPAYSVYLLQNEEYVKETLSDGVYIKGDKIISVEFIPEIEKET